MFGVGDECKNGATVVCWAKVGDGDVDGGAWLSVACEQGRHDG